MKNLVILCALLLPVSLGACGFEIVDTGHRGVKTTFGEVIGEALPEGLHFYNPFTSNIVEMEVRTIRNDSETVAYTKDVQQAAIKYTVNYHLDPARAHTMFKNVGRDWEQKIVPQVVSGSIKSVIGQWEAVVLVEKRQEATMSILKQIATSLEQKSVIVENFELTDISYTDEFEKAVEAKVTAIQRASEAENKTRQIEEEAKQKVIAAKAEAESMRIRSDALSQNKSLVEYEAVQKWDGQMPQYMMGNSIPFINITNK